MKRFNQMFINPSTDHKILKIKCFLHNSWSQCRIRCPAAPTIDDKTFVFIAFWANLEAAKKLLRVVRKHWKIYVFSLFSVPIWELQRNPSRSTRTLRFAILQCIQITRQSISDDIGHLSGSTTALRFAILMLLDFHQVITQHPGPRQRQTIPKPIENLHILQRFWRPQTLIFIR